MEEKNQTFDARIKEFEDILERHERRIENVEKGLDSMNDKIEHIDSKQDKLFDKIDGHTDIISQLRVDLPGMLANTVDENAKRTQLIIDSHQTICTKKLDEKYLVMPDGWRGKLVKLAIVGLGLLFGLNEGGLLQGKESEQKSKQVQQEFLLKDQMGNTYKLIPSTTEKKDK